MEANWFLDGFYMMEKMVVKGLKLCFHLKCFRNILVERLFGDIWFVFQLLRLLEIVISWIVFRKSLILVYWIACLTNFMEINYCFMENWIHLSSFSHVQNIILIWTDHKQSFQILSNYFSLLTSFKYKQFHSNNLFVKSSAIR